MKLKETTQKMENGIKETLTYCDFPGGYWTRIRTNKVIERLNREIRCCTCVVESFLDGHSALILTVLDCAMWPAPSEITRNT